ncbi:class I SAM-dependent methyltransferase [Oceaniglobus roseus]|uniref:class I SAM-dependent methyltransferase n=1 Tax=Oceaniglobus roseus TaxID=1737570 RepID=UPI000C7EB3F8|nr:class I SAM-dependent methyltransferase [Kandeliimicrobium roseum]
MTPFFQLHSGLLREGPGTPEDVAWALEVAGTPARARICDAGCGPGADTVTLAQLRPAARIEAVDAVPHFVTEARARLTPFADRVTVNEDDMAGIEGPYDLIWCAGALYFLGVTEGLRGWRGALAPGGHVAFSEPCLTGEPSAAVRAFWADYPALGDLDDIAARVGRAGFRVLDHRMVTGQAWKAYYDPMVLRIAGLREAADDELSGVLDEHEREIALWREAAGEIAYALMVVAPR